MDASSEPMDIFGMRVENSVAGCTKIKTKTYKDTYCPIATVHTYIHAVSYHTIELFFLSEMQSSTGEVCPSVFELIFSHQDVGETYSSIPEPSIHMISV